MNRFGRASADFIPTLVIATGGDVKSKNEIRDGTRTSQISFNSIERFKGIETTENDVEVGSD